MTGSRLARRFVLAVLLSMGVVLGVAGTASAHVTVDGGGARRGAQDAVLTFRVPNERSGARTVGVTIKFPTLTPVGSVKPAQKAGWTWTTKRITYATPITTPDGEITEGVGEVTFTASSPTGGTPDGGFDTFQVLVGPLPQDAATIAFPTVQTYSNGQVSSWIQPTTPGSEPSNPAPVLDLTAAGAGPASGDAASSADAEALRTDVGTARILSIVGVIAGSLGMLAAGIAIGRTRQPVVAPVVGSAESVSSSASSRS